MRWTLIGQDGVKYDSRKESIGWFDYPVFYCLDATHFGAYHLFMCALMWEVPHYWCRSALALTKYLSTLIFMEDIVNEWSLTLFIWYQRSDKWHWWMWYALLKFGLLNSVYHKDILWWAYHQHLVDCGLSLGFWLLSSEICLVLVFSVPSFCSRRCFMSSLVTSIKASSTFYPVKALTSNQNGVCNLSASPLSCAAFTTRLSERSHLLPIRQMSVSGLHFCVSIFCSQCASMFRKVSSLVTSHTKTIQSAMFKKAGMMML